MPTPTLALDPNSGLRAFVKIPGLHPYGDKTMTEREAALPALTMAELIRLRDRVAKAISTLREKEASETESRKKEMLDRTFVPGVRIRWRSKTLFGAGMGPWKYATIVHSALVPEDIKNAMARIRHARAIVMDHDTSRIGYLSVDASAAGLTPFEIEVVKNHS